MNSANSSPTAFPIPRSFTTEPREGWWTNVITVRSRGTVPRSRRMNSICLSSRHPQCGPFQSRKWTPSRSKAPYGSRSGNASRNSPMSGS